jgi:hypothetical protein
MWWFEIDINSPNPIGDRLRAVVCDREAPQGYAYYFGSWIDPQAACEAFDRMAYNESLEQSHEDTTQPGGKALADL